MFRLSSGKKMDTLPAGMDKKKIAGIISKKKEKHTIMTTELTASARRVQDFISAKGFSFNVKELPGSTRTAQEAADSIGCAVSQIAKSLVFKEKKSSRPVLIIASGTNRVDIHKIETATGWQLGRADGKYVKETVGFAIGGIPPVAHNQPLETLLDPDLKNYDTIWAAAGTPFAVFELTPGDLESLTSGKWVDLAE
jgi:prolyl-tRNA editing enzyme YbaK/EbsC (Cys-tRNA(Pro) deacylase)